MLEMTEIDPRNREWVRGEMEVRGNEFVWTLDGFSKHLWTDRYVSISSPTSNFPNHEDGRWKVKLVLYPRCPCHADCNHMSMQLYLTSNHHTYGEGSFVFWTKRLICDDRHSWMEMVNRQKYRFQCSDFYSFGPIHFVGRKKVEDPKYGIRVHDRIEVHCSVTFTASSNSNSDESDFEML